MTFKSDTQPLCRYCAKPIAKYGTGIYVREKPPNDHYMEDHWGFKNGQRVVIRQERRPIHVPKHVIGKPRTKAELVPLLAQISNQPLTILSIRRRDDPEFIAYFTVWDGESYADEFFCNGDHAKRFADAAARIGVAMPVYNDAIKKRRAKLVTAA